MDSTELEMSGCITKHQEKQVLVLYVGGTIGMKPSTENGLTPEADIFPQQLKEFCQLHDPVYAGQKWSTSHSNNLVLPLTEHNIRIIYHVKEYQPLLDSSNMCTKDWQRIADDIKDSYQIYDGFVVVQGTDTLCYTSSALSFMLRNLGKTVVVTGSQLPIFNVRSDGVRNLLYSLIFAGSYYIPEVTVFFGTNLYRGNRTTKVSTVTFDGFISPNIRPLATIGPQIKLCLPNYENPSEEFFVRRDMNTNVVVVTIFPEMSVKIVRSSLEAPTEGVVLMSYGAGNVPSNRIDILDTLRNASDRGVIIINCSQCLEGTVTSAYETNRILSSIGVISGADMTMEAAFTKLQYILSMKNLTIAQKKQIMLRELRMELTRESSRWPDILD